MQNEKLSKALFLLIFLLGISGSACSSGGSSGVDPEEEEEDITLQIVDKDATKETKALLSQLWRTQEKGIMFGHHDDLLYGRYWMAEPGRSDIKDVVGDYPAVYSIDFAEIMDSGSAVDGYDLNEDRKRTIIEAYERGEVITANLHLGNPLTGGDAWDNSSDQVVKEILTDGSETNIKYKGWLDNLAEFANNLKDGSGTLIPILFRPYHEHTQSWSWWGSTSTTQEEFIGLWRFTIEYLKEEKGVHNFLYAISPQLDGMATVDHLLYRWPGDEYVDFIGMDSYHGTNRDAFIRNLKNLESLSKEKKKPAGVTETGMEGIREYGSNEPIDDYWTEQIMLPFIGRELSMVVMWRNQYDPNENGHHYYAPFEGHSSSDDFIEMYESSLFLFSEDLPAMYQMAEGIAIE
jgi:mannan endo-1,4-beta-mannosidase